MASSRWGPGQPVDDRRPIRRDDARAAPKRDREFHDVFLDGHGAHGKISTGMALDDIRRIGSQPPEMIDMEEAQKSKNGVFMIAPYRNDSSRPDRYPTSANDDRYVDRWDKNHVLMPCSEKFIKSGIGPLWPVIRRELKILRQKCENNIATIADLKETITYCTGRQYDLYCLEKLIDQKYSPNERRIIMSSVLANICSLALDVEKICGQPPPLLRRGSDRSVTMSQHQAASLLACAFFCLFPYRSQYEQSEDHRDFQDPNFNRLYENGPPQKIEKLKCILHYFKRITDKRPNGVISFRRSCLPDKYKPIWPASKKRLCDVHLTTEHKIEDVNNVLQVDFANKYIGGGVLGTGCVQEEIRFSICPEMLVSLLICEVMDPDECIFLIGCERYCSYEGYADSFAFAGNYDDMTIKDKWGRKWCHLVAMDAIFFRDRNAQYDMKNVQRELIKAYTCFRPRKTGIVAGESFGIVTGNWGCGVFNGDTQLKAIIQLMAASEAERPLIYAAYCDKKLISSFEKVYEYLKNQNTTVNDLYQYLDRYSTRYQQTSLFDFILNKPKSSAKS